MRKPSSFPHATCLLGLLAALAPFPAAHGAGSTDNPAGRHDAIVVAQHPAPDVTPVPPIYGPPDEGPSFAQTVSDTVLAARIRSAFTVHQELLDSDIHVDADDGAVSLSGSAISESAKERAIEVAAGVEGVKKVDGESVKVE